MFPQRKYFKKDKPIPGSVGVPQERQREAGAEEPANAQAKPPSLDTMVASAERSSDVIMERRARNLDKNLEAYEATIDGLEVRVLTS